jgi:hypothetical protein
MTNCCSSPQTSCWFRYSKLMARGVLGFSLCTVTPLSRSARLLCRPVDRKCTCGHSEPPSACHSCCACIAVCCVCDSAHLHLSMLARCTVPQALRLRQRVDTVYMQCACTRWLATLLWTLTCTCIWNDKRERRAHVDLRQMQRLSV